MGQTITKYFTFMAPTPSYMKHNFKTITKRFRFDGSEIPYVFIQPEKSLLKQRNQKKRSENTLESKIIQVDNDNWTILFSHGNSFDLGLCLPFLEFLSQQLQVNVCCYDYTGYGQNHGEASEENCLRDVEDVYHFLLKNGVSPEKIILMGHSLGGGVTLSFAKKLCQNFHSDEFEMTEMMEFCENYEEWDNFEFLEMSEMNQELEKTGEINEKCKILKNSENNEIYENNEILKNNEKCENYQNYQNEIFHQHHQIESIGIAGIITISTFTSIVGVVSSLAENILYNMFDNKNTINKICVPLYILHGEKDELIHPNQAIELYDHVKKEYKFGISLIPDANHNDILFNPLFIENIKEFLMKLEQY